MTKYFVYSKPNCTYCDQAKALLEQKGASLEVFNLDVGQPKVEGEQYISRDELLKIFPFARTMPQITVSMSGAVERAQYVGGFAELKKFISEAE